MKSTLTQPGRVLGYHNDLLPGWNIVYALEGISGPDALSNPYYRDLLDACGVNRLWDWRYMVETTETERLRPILDALGVRDYLGYHVAQVSPDERLQHIASDDMEVFASTTAWPRAFFTDEIATYDGSKQFWTSLKTGDGRPFAAMERWDWDHLQARPKISGQLAGRTILEATNYRTTTNTTSFTVAANGPGVIVLGEAYEPDNFRAWLNGKRVGYSRVNHAFKGIVVDAAGIYEVRFSYWPHGLSGALYCCGAGLTLLVLMISYGAFRVKLPATLGRVPLDSDRRQG
ncbi:MAG TPA: hypothetical protein VFE25_02005 [Opitutaceae bacterium]|nr:hypothetical protein [Opitutaceae bacterium]